jgi:cytochrome c biogenesis protein CcdA
LGNNLSDNFREFTNSTQDYIETSINYYQLDLFKKIMKGLVSASYKMILAFFFLIALLFLSVAAAMYVGRLLNDYALGCLVVGGFYLIIMIILFMALKKPLEKFLLSKASKQFFSTDDHQKNI